MSLFLFVGVLFSCQSREKSNERTNPETGIATDSVEMLYPFAEFIKSEVTYLDSTPLAIIKTVAEDGTVKDSGMATLAEAKDYASLFTSIDPNLKQWRPLYKEQAFVDMTLGYNTFIIEALQPDLPLKTATILVHPETNQVERLILQQQQATGKDTTIRMLTWRKHKSLQVVEQFGSTQTPSVRITNLKWDY